MRSRFATITPLSSPSPPLPIAVIAPPKGAPVRPFNVDPALPPCAVADALWDAVGAAHGMPTA
jgi:hypothetical protein